ncbi:MAG: porphobilinogen synthase [Synergistaceae bacterium]|jgi:porphobilinogen synthase|nr:porphobilinogen synthase [Synergistaceae bacterium]
MINSVFLPAKHNQHNRRAQTMIIRPRRLRRSKAIRSMICETRLSQSMLVYPMFVKEGHGIEEEIAPMPGQKRFSVDRLLYAVERVLSAGVSSILLFGLPEKKDFLGSEAYASDGIIPKALRELKRRFPELLCVTDVCLCEYTDHGHCGCPSGGDGYVDNDTSLPLLAKAALSHARAGADVVAPSDMMDGRVAAIRAALDEDGYVDTAIMSYSVKYASAFYGPFREAADSAPAFGDRRTYQMDPRNRREALREIELDAEEGADMVMVKPGLPYLDILSAARDISPVPVGAYSVSGEYSMIKAASERGWIDERRVVCETAFSLVRAGADILMTYHAPELAEWLSKGEIEF